MELEDHGGAHFKQPPAKIPLTGTAPQHGNFRAGEGKGDILEGGAAQAQVHTRQAQTQLQAQEQLQLTQQQALQQQALHGRLHTQLQQRLALLQVMQDRVDAVERNMVRCCGGVCMYVCVYIPVCMCV
jgi:hypothetical protein